MRICRLKLLAASRTLARQRSAVPGGRNLLSLPVRRALVEEGIHSLAEILAHIGAKDQILAFIARQRPPDPADRLLGDLERDRRMAGNQLRGLVGTALQRLDIRYHFV